MNLLCARIHRLVDIVKRHWRYAPPSLQRESVGSFNYTTVAVTIKYWFSHSRTIVLLSHRRRSSNVKTAVPSVDKNGVPSINTAVLWTKTSHEQRSPEAHLH